MLNVTTNAATQTAELLKTGVQLHQAGKLQEAEQIYRQVLARQPNHPDALHLLGVLAYQVGQAKTAVDLLGRAVAANPGVGEYYNHLGAALTAAGKPEDAVAAYNTAAHLKPDMPETYNNLGNALGMQGHWDEAVAAYQHGLELEPNLAEAQSNLGNALRAKGQLDEAIAACRKALVLRPDYPDACNNLANALRDKGQNADAVEWYRKALAGLPDQPMIHHNLGVALRACGKFDEAVTAFQQALTLQPGLTVAQQAMDAVIRDKERSECAINVGLDSTQLVFRSLAEKMARQKEALEVFRDEMANLRTMRAAGLLKFGDGTRSMIHHICIREMPKIGTPAVMVDRQFRRFPPPPETAGFGAMLLEIPRQVTRLLDDDIGEIHGETIELFRKKAYAFIHYGDREGHWQILECWPQVVATYRDVHSPMNGHEAIICTIQLASNRDGKYFRLWELPAPTPDIPFETPAVDPEMKLWIEANGFKLALS